MKNKLNFCDFMENNNVNELVKKQFGREAEKYVTSQVHNNPADLKFILTFIDPNPSWNALDIATGGGHLALNLSPKVAKIYATDLTEEMLEQVDNQAKAKGITNLVTKLEDVHNLSFPDNSFDLVCVRLAPHHFHDIAKALQEMKRVAKKGGFIFIQDTLGPQNPEAKNFFNKIEKMRDPSHVHDLSESEWVDLFRNTGLKILKQDKHEKSWPFLWWTERMSTPINVVEEIRTLLLDNKQKFRYSIRVDIEEDNDLTIRPLNIYILAQKE